jgi:hypothetical protein
MDAIEITQPHSLRCEFERIDVGIRCIYCGRQLKSIAGQRPVCPDRDNIPMCLQRLQQYRANHIIFGAMVSLHELEERFNNYCTLCEEFDGLACTMFGCTSNRNNRERYYACINNPEAKCPHRDDGFPCLADATA